MKTWGGCIVDYQEQRKFLQVSSLMVLPFELKELLLRCERVIRSWPLQLLASVLKPMPIGRMSFMFFHTQQQPLSIQNELCILR